CLEVPLEGATDECLMMPLKCTTDECLIMPLENALIEGKRRMLGVKERREATDA
ncbi:hypothetical protein NPIL_47611, partial [Nephila pilipes]